MTKTLSQIGAFALSMIATVELTPDGPPPQCYPCDAVHSHDHNPACVDQAGCIAH
jgi:hypothetical protein